MSKFLKNIFLFLLCAFPGYMVLLLLAGILPIPQALKPNLNYCKGGYGQLYTRLNEVRKINSDIDILFLGSSHAYRGFDPRNFPGIKSFNLGSSQQTPIQTKVLLQRYLDKINTKTVVYEVYPGTFDADGVESALDLISNDKNDFKSVQMAFELNNIKTYNTLIYAHLCEKLNWHASFKENTIKGEDTYIPGGFVESKIRHFKFDHYSEREWGFKEEQVRAFKENLEMLNKKNIKVILVFAPITPLLYRAYTNNQYFDSMIRKTYPNVEYYNFNKLIQLNDSLDFYDSHHLNQRGVNAFNKKLLDVLNNSPSLSWSLRNAVE